ELAQGRPARVARPPFRLGAEPDREGLREVLVGMALRVPGVEVQHEALAVRPRRIVLRIGLAGAAEALLPPLPPPQPVGVLDRVAGLVTEDLEAPVPGAALHLEHLALLQPAQPRVDQVERDGHAGHAVGTEPFVGEPEVRPEVQATRLQLADELGDAVLDAGALDAQVEVARPEGEQPLAGPRLPGPR